MQEITINDPFGYVIALNSIGKACGLEVGGGTGDGSTQCIKTSVLFSIENSPERISQHRENLDIKHSRFSIQGNSSDKSQWMTRDDVINFYKQNKGKYPIEMVLSWYEKSINEAIPFEGSEIEKCYKKHGLSFDFVLLDGGPFCGEADLNACWDLCSPNAIIALDDVLDIKNLNNYKKLKKNHCLLWENLEYRNGAAIFKL